MNFYRYNYYNLVTSFSVLFIKSKTLKQKYSPTLSIEIAVFSMIKKKTYMPNKQYHIN
jgi:hypothetical protein